MKFIPLPIGLADVPDLTKWLAQVKHANILKPCQSELLRFTYLGKLHCIYARNGGAKMGRHTAGVEVFVKEYVSQKPRRVTAIKPVPPKTTDITHLNTVVGRAKFAKWLEQHGATLLMPDLAKLEVLVYRWINSDGMQLTERVWGTTGSHKLFSTDGVPLMVDASKHNKAMRLGGATPRMKVSNSTVGALINRDGHICVYCGKTAAQAGFLTIEHFIPVSHGGTNHIDNLSFACKPCNQAAGNMAIAQKIRIRDGIRAAKEYAA